MNILDSTNKNILFIQTSLDPSEGGVPRVTDLVSKKLNENGNNCFYIYYTFDNNEYKDDVKLKIDLTNSYKVFEEKMFFFIKKNNINVIICQNAYNRKFIMLYKQIREKFNIRLIVFYHASPEYYIIQYKKNPPFCLANFTIILKNFIKRIAYTIYDPYTGNINDLYSVSERFVLLSPTFRDSFARIYKISNTNKLLSIPNPLTFKEYPTIEEIAQKEKIVLIVGRLAEIQKRISVALRIWHKIHKLGNNGWKLVIVGEGPDEKSYKKYVNSKSMESVQFVGRKTNVSDYYRKSSIFIMASIWEGLPMTIMEALQNGCVPISFDNFSSIHDMITDGNNGYIISNNDIDVFSKKLYDLMNNNDLRIEMSKNAVESCKKFSIDKIIKQWNKDLLF